MKKLITVVALVACLLLPGCMQVDSTLKVNPDGSGELDLTQLIDKSMYVMMQGEEEEDPMAEEKVRKDIEKLGEGVKMIRFEKVDKPDWIGVHVKASVKDVSKLKNLIFDMGGKSKESPSFKWEKGKDGATVLQVNIPKVKKAEKKPDEGELKIDGKSSGSMMKAFYQKLVIKIRVVPVGEIIKTDGKKTSKNEFILFDFDGRKIDWSKVKDKELEDGDVFMSKYKSNPKTFSVTFK